MKQDIFFAAFIGLLWLREIMVKTTPENIIAGVTILCLLAVCLIKQKRIVDLERKFGNIGG